MATGASGGTTGSAAGTTGSAAGTTGSAAGTTGSTGGTTGSAAGTTGSAAGATGSAAGTTGSTGGTTGSAAGTTGSAAGTTGSAGGRTGTGGTTGSTGGRAGTGGTTGSTGGTTGSTGGTTGSTAGAAGGSGSSKCTLPNLPDGNSLPVKQKLPDPFTFFDGTKVTTKQQWECRRKEILAMAAKYIYGPAPAVPDEVSGTVSGGTVSITVKVGSKTETFSASISGSGSVIAFELSGGIFPSARKKLTFGSGFETKIKNLFGFSEINTNVANGWMIDRVMDVLEKNPTSGHDPQKIMVSGCSGCGKGAFLAGVFSRAPLVVIVESGGGGAANFRQAEWFRHGGGKAIWQCESPPQSIDNLEDNGICGPWVTGAASWLRSAPAKVYNLPIDQHLLLATIAPRYLLHFSNNNGKNSWCHLGGTCEALSSWAAKPVWKALGVPERMGFHMYSAGHCSNPAEAVSLAGEFFKRAFEGNTSAKTDVMNIMANGVQQPVSEWKGMWIDWDMETVLK